MKAQHHLEHLLWKSIKEHSLQDKKVLLAFSGGIDSVALFYALKKVHSSLEVFHYHHGPCGDPEQKIYRDNALQFAQKICEDTQTPFNFSKNNQQVNSEADFRALRYAALQKVFIEKKMDVIATAHHQDDLLETRMLRLIRGTGSQGLVAMEEFKNSTWRPFLGVSKKQLQDYLQVEGKDFISDPSNKSTEPMRNWLREEWLESLEKKAPGSLESLSRSLQTLSLEIKQNKSADLMAENKKWIEEGISRPFFISLSHSDQKKLLAQFLLSLNVKDFTQSHLEEICKRLDNSQKVITFVVAKLQWKINAEQIKV